MKKVILFLLITSTACIPEPDYSDLQAVEVICPIGINHIERDTIQNVYRYYHGDGLVLTIPTGDGARLKSKSYPGQCMVKNLEE